MSNDILEEIEESQTEIETLSTNDKEVFGGEIESLFLDKVFFGIDEDFSRKEPRSKLEPKDIGDINYNKAENFSEEIIEYIQVKRIILNKEVSKE